MNPFRISKIVLWGANAIFLAFLLGCAAEENSSPGPSAQAGSDPPTTPVTVSLQSGASVLNAAKQAVSLAPAPSTVTQIKLEVNDSQGSSLIPPLTLSPSRTGPVTASFDIPSGAGRVFIARALGGDGTMLFQGQVTVDLPPNVLTKVGIEMVPNAIIISPSNVSVAASTSQQFAATIVGLSSQSVTWSVNGVSGGNSTVGTIASISGNPAVYTAPASPATSQIITIRATSVSSPGIFGEATVSISGGVITPPPSTVLIQPYGIAIEPGGTTAVVTDSICCGNQGRLSRVDLTTLQPIETVASGFSVPRGVAIEPGTGAALVIDSGTCCSTSGTLTRVSLTTGAKTVVASGLGNPTGITLEEGGNTALVSGGSQLYRINLTSGAVTPVSNVGGLGVSLEPDGLSALVVSFNLSRVDLATGSISQLPVSQGLSGTGLVVESNDYALITQTLCCSSTGGILSRMNLATGVLQTIGLGLNNPAGIAVESTGQTVLVVEQGTACCVPGTPKITRLNLPVSKVKPVFMGFSNPKGIAKESTGTALVVDERGTLSRIDPASGAITSITSRLNAPQRVVVESGGTTALVTQRDNLSRVHLTTGAITPLCTGLLSPTGISIEVGGASALVSESGSGKLLRCNLSSGTVTVIAVDLSSPQNVQIEPGGASAVVLSGGNLSRVILASGIVTRINSNCCFPAYSDFAIESGGSTALVSIASCCSSSGEMQRIDLRTGNVISTLVSSLNQPNALIIESSGASALVIEPGAKRISRVNLTALTITPVVYWLGAPAAIAIESSENSALVLDSTLGRVLRLNLSSGALTLLASGLSSPSGIAMESGEDTVLVVEGPSFTCCTPSPEKLTRVTLATGALSTITTLLDTLRSVAIGSGGDTAFVTEFTSGRVMEVDLTSGTVTVVTSGLSSPQGIAIEAGGTSALVAGGNSCCSSTPVNGLHRITLASGARTPISTTQSFGQVAVETGGTTALVTGTLGCCSGINSLIRVDLATGTNTTLATGLGGAFSNFSLGLAILPDGQSALVTDPVTGKIVQVPLP